MNKKYKLLKTDKKTWDDKPLFQVQALISFGTIKKGDKGGFIEKEENLDKDGNAWVSGNARVYGNAWVSGNARVYGNAWVFGNARVYGNAWVFGDAWVSGNARICFRGELTISTNYELTPFIKIDTVEKAEKIAEFLKQFE